MNPRRAVPLAAVLVMAQAACSPNAAADPSASIGPSSPLEESTSPSPSTTASATSTPSASGVAGDEWQRVLAVTGDATPEVAREVVHGQAGFLSVNDAFEFAEGGPHRWGRSMWLSPDGLTWEGVHPSGEIASAVLYSLTTTPDGAYVIYHGVQSADGEHSLTQAVRSSDGRTWQPFESGLPDDFQIVSIDHGGRGSLLVGYEYGPATNRPTAWFSEDGLSWELVRDLSEGTRWVTVADGGAGAEGFVIVGTSSAEDNSSHEWFAHASSDGRTWLTTRSPFGPEDPAYRPDPHVAALGADWVASLPSPDGSVRFWQSENGLDWVREGDIASSGPLEAFEPFFQEVDGRLYFSLVRGRLPYFTDGAWSSADGRTWEPLDLGADVYLGGVATGAGNLVISATEVAGESNLTAGIWVRRAD